MSADLVMLCGFSIDWKGQWGVFYCYAFPPSSLNQRLKNIKFNPSNICQYDQSPQFTGPRVTSGHPGHSSGQNLHKIQWPLEETAPSGGPSSTLAPLWGDSAMGDRPCQSSKLSLCTRVNMLTRRDYNCDLQSAMCHQCVCWHDLAIEFKSVFFIMGVWIYALSRMH